MLQSSRVTGRPLPEFSKARKAITVLPELQQQSREIKAPVLHCSVRPQFVQCPVHQFARWRHNMAAFPHVLAFVWDRSLLRQGVLVLHGPLFCGLNILLTRFACYPSMCYV